MIMPRKEELNVKLRAESINKIIETSTRLFAEKGFFKCKMTDIAEAAGMSVGNLYWYYKGKEDVLKAVLQAGFRQQETLLSDINALDITAEEKLEQLLDAYIIMCKELNDFFIIVMNLMANSGLPYLYKLGFNTTEIGIEYHRLLTKLLDESSCNSCPEEELALLPVFFFSLFSGMMLVYGADWHNIHPEHIKAAVKRLLNWKG